MGVSLPGIQRRCEDGCLNDADQSVDTQQGGGFCPTPPFSGVGSRDSLEAFVFLSLQ